MAYEIHPEAFIAPEAFGLMHARGVAIDFDEQQWHGAHNLLHTVKADVPPSLEEITFVFRSAEPGLRPVPDPRLKNAGPQDLYVHDAQLAIPLSQTPEASYHKSAIEALGKTVLEVDVGRAERPLMHYIAWSVLWPPAEDHRLIAPPAAWARQFGRAFNFKTTDSDRRRTGDEVAKRFAGAVALRPRGT